MFNERFIYLEPLHGMKYRIKELCRCLHYLFLGFIFSYFKLVKIIILSYFEAPNLPFWWVTPREMPRTGKDPEWGEHKYIKVYNVKLHYVEKGIKTNPLIILVHGFPECWFSWRHQLVELSKKFWVVALDMRGCGDSTKPKSIEAYQLKWLIKDIRAFFDSTGKNRFTLISNDWGAIICWKFASIYPEILDAFIVINGPSLEVWKELTNRNFEQFLKSRYVYLFLIPWIAEFILRSNDLSYFRAMSPIMGTCEIDVFRHYYHKPMAFTYPLNWYRANVITQRPKMTINPRFSEVPSLLIWGEKDRYFSTETPRYLKKQFPHIRIERLTDGDHFVHQNIPAVVNAIILQFLYY